MSVDKHALWVEKYRPQTLDEYIFHDANQEAVFRRFVEEQTIPHLLLSGVQGSGKAQPLHSNILTPTGWKKMGDVAVGDEVVTPTGGVAKVQQIFPQGEKDIFTVTFHDGATAECCLDHLWECYFVDKWDSRKATKHVIDTRSIISLLNKQQKSSTKFNISVPLIVPTNTTDKELSVDPYLLGVFLGDGSLCSPTPKLTTIDSQIINECTGRLKDGYKLTQIKNTIKEFHLINENRTNFGGSVGISENHYTAYFRSVGLYKKRSHEKFIPTEYKTSSVQQRWELIRGLMDTDGTISKTGNSVSYTTVSSVLAHDMQEVLWSLGCTCSITTRTPTYVYKGNKLQGKLAYTLHINHNDGTSQFFHLERKKSRGIDTFAADHNRGNIQLRRRIVSVEHTSTEEAQCILIDDKDHLYVTDNYVVTHNTTLAQIMVHEMGIDETDILTLNASDENSVDVIRDKIKGFISTFAMGKFKIVHLEEADYITGAGQGVMRRLMEEYADVSRFILTCNYENKIIPAIKSRCQQFRFKSPDRDDVTEYAAKVLISEHIKFEIDLLDKYVSTGFPDIRKIVNLLQQNSIDGKLQTLRSENEAGDYKFKLLDLIERDQWLEARKLTCANVAAEEWEDVYRFLYENLHKAPKFQDQNRWDEGIVIIADHLYKHGIVADPEINAAAMFIRMTQI